MIVVIGFMGAGKTTIGHMLAERLGIPFLDSDLVIERQQGRAIKDIFATDGEPTFRQIEHDTIVSLLAGDDVVLALGGGATMREDTRQAMRGHEVVYLQVSLEEALLRVGRDEFRPMLHLPDVEGLYARRLPIMESCASLAVPTDGRRAETIMQDVLQQLSVAAERPGVESVLVTAAGGTYRASVGTGLIDRVEELLPPLSHCEQAVVVCTGPNQELAARAAAGLDRRGWTVREVVLAVDGLGSWPAVGELLAALASAGVHRHDLLLAVGGETLCETAGFAASVYHRGMRLALVPTTLASQADSSIGGKTAVSAGPAHRVAGSWHQPVAVIADAAVAARPEHPDWLDGAAELAKHALVSGGSMAELLTSEIDGLAAGSPEAVTRLVRESVAVKAGIVSADEREQGERLVLSYGHAVAVAVEQVHGPVPGAVALGMTAAAYLANGLSMLPDDEVAEHQRVIESVGLPTRMTVDVDAVIDAMTFDKRYRGGVRMTLLRGLGKPATGVHVEREALRAALEQLAG